MADNTAEVFVYTGEGADVPRDVARVRIDPSVLVIPVRAFKYINKLQEVEFHDGIREIGSNAFCNCQALNGLQLSDGVESIGIGAFSKCNFTKFRSPPLVTTISQGMLYGCTGLFSLDLPEIIIQVEGYAFCHCYSLRNIALASNTAVAGETAMHAFQFCTDLFQIFGTEEAIVNALQIRFNGLPVHCKMYYISYYPVVLEEFHNMIKRENGELDPTGLHQDCLGMTPLHILACSTVQCLELYQVMIENYPQNLIVEDAWGATPLLYAIWGDAPNEIVQFLVNSYQSLYPNHEFNWNDMLITLGQANASKAVIRNLLRHLQPTLSPEYNIDWDQVLGVLAERGHYGNQRKPVASPETFCFLTRRSIVTRVNAIGVMQFRDAMADDWTGSALSFNRQAWRDETLAKLEYYESEYGRLKETTSILELAIWRMKINDGSKDLCETMGGGNKKIKRDGAEFRLQCRISCGANIVIKNVWPYLLPSKYVHS
jgi:hypothetical protein